MRYEYNFGIIGGMGPTATIELQCRIVSLTKATMDQEHLNYCLLNIPQIPDRTQSIHDHKIREALIQYLNTAICDLNNIGCKYFVIPCNTVHSLINRVIIPEEMVFINMINETKKYIDDNYSDKRIIILGTDGNKASGQYDNLANSMINYPNYAVQKELVEIIYKVKSGNNFLDFVDRMIDLCNEISKEYEGDKLLFITACTELSLFSKKLSENYLIVDPMDVLARLLVCISNQTTDIV